MDREKVRQVRAVPAEINVRDDDGAGYIEGYFAVFNSDYNILPGKMSESIAPGAFSETISDDIRALVNHDATLILGRTKTGTLQLKEDSHGLWGKIKINPDDYDAMNLYQRVKRGDVDGCSIGFVIISEETERREDGSVHWTIKKVKLYEVSCCTFPAYEDTNIAVRERDRDTFLARQAQVWREKMKARLNAHGTEITDAQEET